LKIRLLLQALDCVLNSERHALVIHEAQAACALAQSTLFPQLVLPCLLEERVGAALRLAEQRDQNYWRRITSCDVPLQPVTSFSV
jgi:hypothetical protein